MMRTLSKTPLAAALAAGLACMAGPALAESFRLAYSQAEGVEIFVEHAAGSPWCAPTLDMRAVLESRADDQALARLMPKLGALLAQQCPAAQNVTWTSVDSAGAVVARGTSSAAAQWTLAVALDAPAAPDATVVAAVPAPTADEAPETPASTASAAVPDAIVPAEPAGATQAADAADEAAAAPASAQTATAPVPPVVASTAPAAAPAVETSVAVQTPAPAPTVAPAPNEPSAGDVPTQAPVASAPTAAGPAAVPDVRFLVNGWQPGTHAEVLASASFLSTRTDQNGCKVVTQFGNLGDAQYQILQSAGLTCDAEGFAQGKGSLEVLRSDGAVLAQLREAWFVRGIPFDQQVARVELAAAHSEGNALWLHLDSDAATQSHHLLRATPMYGNIKRWQLAQVDVITGDVSAFRDVAAIRARVAAATSALTTHAVAAAPSADITFFDTFERDNMNGWGRTDHRVYQVNASRKRDYRSGRIVSDWAFDPRHATNHLFARDARDAEEKRRLEQQQAQERLFAEQRAERERQQAQARLVSREREHLREFERLTDIQQRNPAALLAMLESDVAYKPGEASAYTRMVRGDTQSVSRIVRVTGRDGDDAKADWPYDLRITGQRDLAKGWYLVKGDASLDRAVRDQEGLPLTRILPASDGVSACAKTGCADLADPLTVVRQRSGDPEWSPERANAVISQPATSASR